MQKSEHADWGHFDDTCDGWYCETCEGSDKFELDCKSNIDETFDNDMTWGGSQIHCAVTPMCRSKACRSRSQF